MMFPLRWQKSTGESSGEGMDLEASPSQRRLKDFDHKEEVESQLRETYREGSPQSLGQSLLCQHSAWVPGYTVEHPCSVFNSHQASAFPWHVTRQYHI